MGAQRTKAAQKLAMRRIGAPLYLACAVVAIHAGDASPARLTPPAGDVSVRTEIFPRPPYSGATYYIYERSGEPICTKLKVCNKYDSCSTEYKQGRYKATEDVKTGEPFSTTPALVIPTQSLAKHLCLKTFSLLGPR